MNIFRLFGDMTHLFSVLLLLLKIYATKSCSGISLKTQELYAMVFLARYLDLFTDYISIYNTGMKIIFILSSLAIVWCMRMHRVVKRSYDKELDTFRHYILIAGSFVLAIFLHKKFTVQEPLASSNSLDRLSNATRAVDLLKMIPETSSDSVIENVRKDGPSQLPLMKLSGSGLRTPRRDKITKIFTSSPDIVSESCI
ncbi:hypothetical protein IFM89_001132 [Coptis chinensis]|uniref:ER lumen protein-retaining receptor n=1 Tax=Coptis chinensis TaxID=261450 RepID=A0A835IJT0_9MAGN|nr:hypothetical protein IFM89_001132 [Coptis chinensis]